MGDGLVKFVFKSLAYTVLSIVFGALAIEYINLSITSHQLRNTIESSVYNACNAFNQESYRADDLSDLMSAEGGLYMSGDIYPDGDRYNYYYGDYKHVNSEYSQWLSSNIVNRSFKQSAGKTSVRAEYEDLELIAKGYESHKATLDNWRTYNMGANLIAQETTPMNLNTAYAGIVGDGNEAYETVEKLFKWNLTQMWSKCNSSMRHTQYIGEDGQLAGGSYVQSDGWRLYTRDAKIVSIDYYVFDLTTESGREDIAEIANINEEYYNRGSENGGNSKILAVRIGYDVPVSYVGITPWGKILSYAMTISNNGRTSGTGDVYGSDYGADITQNDETLYTPAISHVKSGDTNNIDDKAYYVWYYNIA